MGQPKPETKPADKPKDRIDLRLFNTIVIYDVYTVARTAENARDTLMAAIAANNVEPTEKVAREITMKNSIRQSWTEQKPWYSTTEVSDEEFEANKEYTTLQIYERFYERRG